MASPIAKFSWKDTKLEWLLEDDENIFYKRNLKMKGGSKLILSRI